MVVVKMLTMIFVTAIGVELCPDPSDLHVRWTQLHQGEHETHWFLPYRLAQIAGDLANSTGIHSEVDEEYLNSEDNLKTCDVQLHTRSDAPTRERYSILTIFVLESLS